MYFLAAVGAVLSLAFLWFLFRYLVGVLCCGVPRCGWGLGGRFF